MTRYWRGLSRAWKSLSTAQRIGLVSLILAVLWIGSGVVFYGGGTSDQTPSNPSSGNTPTQSQAYCEQWAQQYHLQYAQTVQEAYDSCRHLQRIVTDTSVDLNR
jgi:hypothetical protein